MRNAKIKVAVSFLMAGLLAAGSAAAAFGPAGKITSLENFTHQGQKNYLVRGLVPAAGHGCANTDWLTIIPTASAEQREVMINTLLAGFLAGKLMEVDVANKPGADNCFSGRPVIVGVRINQ